MYVSPRYRELTGQEPPAPIDSSRDDRVAPEDRGERLATLPRPSREGPAQELRVTLAEYEGHKFLSLRVWVRNEQRGAWYPDPKRGCSVRLKEATAVADAIRRGLELAGGEPEARNSGRTVGARGRGAHRRDAAGRAGLPEATRGEFSEF